MATRFISFEHTRLAVHVAGHGPLAILIHGYPLDHRQWLDTRNGSLAGQRTLAAIDLRGHGLSPWCGDPVHTMALFADDIAAVIHTLADDPVDVVGLSMGGYVAQALWAAHPTLVRSLVLTNTRAAADSPASREGREAAIRGVLANGRKSLADAMLPKLLASGADPLVTARVQTMIESLPVETIVADLRGLMVRPDRTAMLPTITVPTLLIAGDADGITPAAEMQSMADAVAGAKLVVVPGSAHLTPMERPAAFAQAVGAFWHDAGAGPTACRQGR